MKPKEHYTFPLLRISWNPDSEVSSCLCFTWVVQVIYFFFQNNINILQLTFLLWSWTGDAGWFSSAAHNACLRSLSLSRVSSLSGAGGDLTVTINTKAGSFKIVWGKDLSRHYFIVHLVFYLYKAVEYWITNHSGAFHGKGRKGFKRQGLFRTLALPTSQPHWTSPRTEMEGYGGIKS